MKVEMQEIYNKVRECMNHNKYLMTVLELKKACLGE